MCELVFGRHQKVQQRLEFAGMPRLSCLSRGALSPSTSCCTWARHKSDQRTPREHGSLHPAAAPSWQQQKRHGKGEASRVNVSITSVPYPERHIEHSCNLASLEPAHPLLGLFIHTTVANMIRRFPLTPKFQRQHKSQLLLAPRELIVTAGISWATMIPQFHLIQSPNFRAT